MFINFLYLHNLIVFEDKSHKKAVSNAFCLKVSWQLFFNTIKKFGIICFF